MLTLCPLLALEFQLAEFLHEAYCTCSDFDQNRLQGIQPEDFSLFNRDLLWYDLLLALLLYCLLSV